MITLQYFRILIKIFLAKHQGYESIRIVGKFYPKTIERLMKNYKVETHGETIFYKSHIRVSWEE